MHSAKKRFIIEYNYTFSTAELRIYIELKSISLFL